MNGIIGMTNLLLNENLRPEHVEKLTVINNCGSSLLTLLNNILDYSKIEVGKIELENEIVDIKHICFELVELFSEYATKKSIVLSSAIDSSVPKYVYGDSTRFRQILTNFVSNSIKFTLQGRVDITAKATLLNVHQVKVEFSVKDTGIGLSTEAKKRLFTFF